MTSSTHPPTLTATYTHPTTSPHSISIPLPPPPTPQISTSHSKHSHNDPTGTLQPEPLHSSPGKTATRAHLKALRDVVKEVQTEMNTFLTKRMEEEKAESLALGGNEKGKSNNAAKAAEYMERDGEVEEEMDDETKALEAEVEKLRREEEDERIEKGKGKKRKKGKE
ncbi:hypothetical protein TWF281_009694 [Arthrobotrys megalospora]